MADRTIVSDEGSFPDEERRLLLPTAHAIQALPRPGTRRRYGQLALLVALSDAAAFWVAILASRTLRFTSVNGSGGWMAALLLGAPMWVAIFAAFRLYKLSSLSPADEFRRIIAAIGVGIAIRIGAMAALDRKNVFPQKWIGLMLILSVILVFGERLVWHKYMGRLRSRGKLTFRALILGANEEAARIAEALQPKASGYAPIGVVQTNGGSWAGHTLPLLGDLARLSEILSNAGVECVFIASSAVSPEQMKRVMRVVRRHDVDVRVSANMTEILASRLTVQPVGGLLALSLQPVRLTGTKAVAKRTFDLVFGSLIVLAASPLWIVVALAIKLTSRGPVLFKQERVGRAARPFTIYKFRTMVDGAESLLGDLQTKNEASGPLFKIKNDPRITGVGKLLRQYSIDELPQLLNVLRGEMSLVGPRPPLAREVAAYEDWHMDRLEVRPGMTGLWQVGRRSDDWSFDDYVRLDLFYIENWSVSYDLFLMLKTVPAVFKGRGNF
jgi:exopolysaccharide biosynthesis polyprenyl glycosylphosphotransferase